jgi:hypothetical protein
MTDNQFDPAEVLAIMNDPELRAEFMRHMVDALTEGQAEEEQRRAQMPPAECEAEDVLAAELEAQTMAAFAVIDPAMKRRGLTWPSQLKRALKPTDDDYAPVTEALAQLTAVCGMSE